jgi:hypothetical protein
MAHVLLFRVSGSRCPKCSLSASRAALAARRHTPPRLQHDLSGDLRDDVVRAFASDFAGR